MTPVAVRSLLVVVAAALVAAAPTSAATVPEQAAERSPASRTESPTETVAGTTARMLPDAETGWLPVDFVEHPLNPVYAFPPDDPRTHRASDVAFPSVLRVDGLLDAPLDGHKWYAWFWKHGLNPRTEHNSGRMILLTADRLEGPWTNRGEVTGNGMAPDGWWQTSFTGGDVVWSPRHRKFFSVPHAARCMVHEIANGEQGCVHPSDNPDYRPSDGVQRLDSFMIESADGVHWTLSETTQPVLPAGPAEFDNHETGYGRLLRETGPGCAERWLWLYRGQRAYGFYTLGLATADDIRGPWTKAEGPVFAPNQEGLFGITTVVRYQGWYQMLWTDILSATRLARSRDLRTWEPFLRTAPGEDDSAPVLFPGPAPHELFGVLGVVVTDDVTGALSHLSTGFDARNLAAAAAGTQGTAPGTVTFNLARSLSGGDPLDPPYARSATPPTPPCHLALDSSK